MVEARRFRGVDRVARLCEYQRLGLYLFALARAPYRQLVTARKQLTAKDNEITRLSTPAEAAPQRLFSIRLPEPSKPGHFGNFASVYFPNVLITSYADVARTLRFTLSMSRGVFMDFDTFHAQVYRPMDDAVKRMYFANPLHVASRMSQQLHLAFVHDGCTSPIGLGPFEITIDDKTSRLTFVIEGLGEHGCFDDGSVETEYL